METTTTNLVLNRGGQIITTSRMVANKFGKKHYNVLRDIDTLECSADFTALNFECSEYKDITGKKLREYIITRDGFAFLAMGFTGKEAAKFKEAYIDTFGRMESFIKNLTLSKKEEAISSLTANNQTLKFAYKEVTKKLKKAEEAEKGLRFALNEERDYSRDLLEQNYIIVEENRLLEQNIQSRVEEQLRIERDSWFTAEEKNEKLKNQLAAEKSYREHIEAKLEAEQKRIAQLEKQIHKPNRAKGHRNRPMYYSKAFKKQVVEAWENSDQSKTAIGLQFGIINAANLILQWGRLYGNPDLYKPIRKRNE